MKNLFIFLLIALFFSSCTLKKVTNHHGVNFLKKKHLKLTINQSNKNDILQIFGTPSTKSTFDNDIWIYVERKISKPPLSLLNFGTDKITVNNVLILEINNMGLLEKKKFLDLNDLNKIEFTKITTGNMYKKNSFIYDFLSSMRQKINDPLGKRKR